MKIKQLKLKNYRNYESLELKLDDSDWSDMVAEQRNMIVKMQRQLDQYIEISRILLNENLDLKDFIKSRSFVPLCDFVVPHKYIDSNIFVFP